MVKKTIHAAPKFPNPAPTTLLVLPQVAQTLWEFVGT